MITLVLALIGFLITDGAFGAQIVGAVELAQVWLWVSSVLVTVIAIFFIGVFTIGTGAMASDSSLGKTGITLSVVGGGIVGVLLSAFLVGVQYASLWLTYYISDNVDKEALSFDMLTQNAQIAIIGFGVLIFVTREPRNFCGFSCVVCM